ncbi:MAG: hypothetical protein SFZ24_09170 [Planctomycetota bacterium]|nr:hypothetical protein [Planctomycetota bacterium]
MRTTAIVLFMALGLWIFAEGESLGEFSGLTTLHPSSEGTPTRLTQMPADFDGTVSVELTGSRSALARAQAELVRGVWIEPGMVGVPATDGRHVVNLLQVLQSYAPLARTGARVASVSPQSIEMEVTELASRSMAVEATLGGVDVVGQVVLSPTRVTVRAPRAALANVPEQARVTARLSEEQTRRLPASGTVREMLRLEAPGGLGGQPGFSFDRGEVLAEFTVRSRVQTERLPLVPVQLVLPPVEAGRWQVEIDAEDRFLPVDVSGPADALERLRAGGEALVAIAALSSDDLAAGIASKDVSFMVLKQGVLSSRPELTVEPGRTSVRLKIAPVAAAEPAP